MRKFRPDIEGLRALAVLVVVLYHADVPGLAGGFSGVDVFFVISGYLITGHLVSEAVTNRKVSIPSFYQRRLRRILPAAVVVLLFVLIVSRLLIGRVRASGTYWDVFYSGVGFANFHFAATGTNYSALGNSPSPLQHFWSLAVEEQFYLVWPVLIGIVALSSTRRVRRTLFVVLAVVFAASLAWSVEQTVVDPSWAYFSPFTRAFELSGGGLVAIAAHRIAKLPRQFGHVLSLAGLATLAVSVFVFDGSTPWPGSYALVPVLGTSAVIAGGLVVTSAGFANRLLGLPPMQFIGRLSYSWYLWHYPVIVFADAWYGNLGWQAKLAWGLAALVPAYLSFKVVESPVRTRAFFRGVRVRWAVAVVALFSLVSLDVARAAEVQVNAQALFANESFLHRSTTVAQVEAAVAKAVKSQHVPSSAINYASEAGEDAVEYRMAQKGCLAAESSTSVQDYSQRCVFGDRNAKRTIALIGDSHAAEWAEVYDAIAKSRHYRLVVLTKSACAPVALAQWNTLLNGPFTQCTKFRPWLLKQVAAIKPAYVVYSASRPELVRDAAPVANYSESLWRAALGATFTRLMSGGAKLITMSDLPRLGQSAPECIPASHGNAQACSQSRKKSEEPPAHSRAEESATSAAGGTYINLQPYLCTSTTCPAIINGMIAYANLYHLSRPYEQYLAPIINRQVNIPKAD